MASPRQPVQIPHVTLSSTPSSRPAALLFDLDGTLIDSIQLIIESVEHAFSGRSGRAPSRAEWMAGIGTPLFAQLREFATDDADLVRLTDAYRAYQRQHHDRLTRCFQGIPDVLAELRGAGHPMGVVTSKADEIARRGLAHVGLLDLMDVLIGADSSTRHKPDPEPVHLALAALGYAPSEAIFVGDAPFDLAAGRAAGVRTIAVTWGAFSREQLAAWEPHAIVDRIEELPGAIRALIAG